MNDLTSKRCKPCEGGVEPLSPGKARDLVAALKGWQLSRDGREIRRTFEPGDYHRVMALVNAVAWIAHVEDHHPDMEVGYGRLVVRFSTHAIGGLSENDFICAAKVDALLPDA